jgi:hypothetical protein
LSYGLTPSGIGPGPDFYAIIDGASQQLMLRRDITNS